MSEGSHLDQLRDMIGEGGLSGRPNYDLRLPGSDVPIDDDNAVQDSLRSQLGRDVRLRRADSGTLGVWFARSDDQGRPDGPFTRAVVQAVLSQVDREDDRVVSSVESDTQIAIAEFDTALRADGSAVVGPGGRIVIYRTATDIRAEIVVRRRIRERSARSRSVDQVMGDVLRELDIEAGRQEISRTIPAIGYLELSKFEIQRFMRLVLLVRVEIDGSETQPPSSFSIVVPLSEAVDVEPTAGLGSWA